MVEDVTYYSKAALYEAFKAWRDKGVYCSGQFEERGAIRPVLVARQTRYDMAGKEINGEEGESGFFEIRIFAGNRWGLHWKSNIKGKMGIFPPVLCL
ncbi:MAG: hypothetical protein JRI56_10140 [Deltaproteobacteria bacterium]|nr:hypothetical protein [Deltaproteobacteria bacterium]